jgi:hypothetical protein
VVLLISSRVDPNMVRNRQGSVKVRSRENALTLSSGKTKSKTRSALPKCHVADVYQPHDERW